MTTKLEHKYQLLGPTYLINKTTRYFFCFLAFGHCEKITEILRVLGPDICWESVLSILLHCSEPLFP